jgi:hypothetical protein
MNVLKSEIPSSETGNFEDKASTEKFCVKIYPYFLTKIKLCYGTFANCSTKKFSPFLSKT